MGNKIKKIALVDTNVSSSLHTSKTAEGMGPLGLQYIAGYLQKKGFDVNILEQGKDNLGALEERIYSYSPDLVGFSNMLSKWDDQNNLTASLKKKMPLYAVVGGPGISGNPSMLTNSNFDYGIRGEGEVALENLIYSISDNKDVSKLNGLIYRSDEGVRVNASERLSEDFLSENNVPAPVENMHGFSQMTGIEGYVSHEELRVGQLAYSRGCPNKCNFCDAHNLWGRKVRWASEKSTVEAMKHLRDSGVNYLFFTDLTFNLNKKRVLSLADEITRENLGLSYFVQATVKNTDEEIVDVLIESGCKKIHFGVEAIAQNELNGMNKSYNDFDRAREALELCNKKGLVTRAYMIMPWESEKQLKIFENEIENLPADEIRLSFMTPFPGTPVWNEYIDSVTTRDLSNYSGDYPIINLTSLKESELIDIRDNIAGKFYGSQKYKERACDKVGAFPHLEKTYSTFLKRMEGENGK